MASRRSSTKPSSVVSSLNLIPLGVRKLRFQYIKVNLESFARYGPQHGAKAVRTMFASKAHQA